MTSDADAVGVARAGAAFAARRKELGLTQRDLAAMKVITTPALVAFEKGRTWPRGPDPSQARTGREVAAGDVVKLNNGGQAPPDGGKASRHDDTSEVLTGAVTMAAGSVLNSARALPEDDDPTFSTRPGPSWQNCANSKPSPPALCAAAKALPRCSSCCATSGTAYDALMARAAAAPGATLGQRLYVARVAATFSVAEAAGAADVAPEVITAAEAEQQLSEADRHQLEKLIANLTS